ncbi:hypothetical protein N1851_014473 [Merluccius polli]|uniref:Uncharacterized protein n=1 Tax=Merluccius polli TaxID=89951 RepID=A0AA47P2Q5_MERPO|nr:hypothetical protein N1851_014473 [Merluccius polli]
MAPGCWSPDEAGGRPELYLHNLLTLNTCPRPRKTGNGQRCIPLDITCHFVLDELGRLHVSNAAEQTVQLLLAHVLGQVRDLGPCRQPPTHKASMLGDLGPYRFPYVKSPIMETLGPGREVVSVVGQYSLLKDGILAGGLGRKVLARLLVIRTPYGVFTTRAGIVPHLPGLPDIPAAVAYGATRVWATPGESTAEDQGSEGNGPSPPGSPIPTAGGSAWAGSQGPPPGTPDTLTATERNDPPEGPESSPLTEFSDFLPAGGEGTAWAGQFASAQLQDDALKHAWSHVLAHDGQTRESDLASVTTTRTTDRGPGGPRGEAVLHLRPDQPYRPILYGRLGCVDAVRLRGREDAPTLHAGHLFGAVDDRFMIAGHEPGHAGSPGHGQRGNPSQDQAGGKEGDPMEVTCVHGDTHGDTPGPVPTGPATWLYLRDLPPALVSPVPTGPATWQVP